jgi:FtsZ-binding cell division protein ZapB
MTVSYTYERPDLKAVEDLEKLLRHLSEEVAGWRRRTLKAEAELQEMRSLGGASAGPELGQARQRLIELETENAMLRQRVDAAKDRVKALAGRVTFLEQAAEVAP